jgi:hypothetical protein
MIVTGPEDTIFPFKTKFLLIKGPFKTGFTVEALFLISGKSTKFLFNVTVFLTILNLYAPFYSRSIYATSLYVTTFTTCCL